MGGCSTPTHRLVLVVFVLHLVLALVLVPVPAAGEQAGWAEPVDAPVLDGFRLPSHQWSAGNRGLAYATTEGQVVAAVDAGTVSFAGQVGGQLHVTVDHGGGLRSTYAYLETIGVVRGQRLARGQPLATATTGFHLTARSGDVYVDPAMLLGGAAGVPRLLPEPSAPGATGGPGGGGGGGLLGRLVATTAGLVAGASGDVAGAAGTAGERLAGLVAGAVDHAGGLPAAAGDAAAGAVAALGTAVATASSVAAWSHLASSLRAAELDPLRALSQLVVDLLPSRQALALARAVASWHRSGDDCTPDQVAVPPPGAGRVLVQVGGLGTSDRGASVAKLDPVAIGYDPRDVVGFSYAGGCTPVPFGLDAVPADSLTTELATSTYSAVDTHQDLELSATHLADLIEDVRIERPGAPIDLAAHSLGGVVARRALEILADRHGGTVPVSVVVTLGSPHQGAELATAPTALALNPWAGPLLQAAAPQRAFEAGATSVSQLARGTEAQLPSPREPPDGVRVVSVAAPGDVVVPAERSWWAGAVNTVAGPAGDVGLDVHGDLPARPEVHRELALAVAGLPARCLSFATAVGAAIVSRTVAAVEGAAAVGGTLLHWP